MQKRSTSLFIGSAPRLAEDVVRPCRLPSRHARAEINALLAPNHAQRLGAFLFWALLMQFRLATWNINSVRLRLELVERFVRDHQPDVLCLQEIKCVDGSFPELALRALGFGHVAIAGQKGYHGVAILSRLPFSSVKRRDICGRGHARHVSIELASAGQAGEAAYFA